MSRPELPEPSPDLQRLSQRLSEQISSLIEEHGPVPFSRFMEMALYQPGLGYYSAGLHKLGASGDFTTSPELGPLFAGCLARQLGQAGSRLGVYDVLEIGAGTGRMAADILTSLPEPNLPGRYRILERSADLRLVQAKTLSLLPPTLRDRVEWLDEPPESTWRGVLLANEVLDALAVERFELDDQGVQQLLVELGPDGFCWGKRRAPADLAAAVESLEIDAQPGFRSEINLHLPAWLNGVTSTMECGLALFIDYGYPRAEYYLPERRDGTIMCHYRHRAHDDVFFWPGLQDITAWVDFTALALAADQCGLDVEGYASQSMFLLGCGLEQVLERHRADADDHGLKLSTEARQLTLPGMMGERFQVMGLGRGLDWEPDGFRLQDLRYRL